MSEINESNIENKNEKRSGGIVVSLLEYVEIIVFAILFVILLFTFFVRLCTVDGASMEETLQDGEVLLVSDLFYEPEQNDIIVFHQTGGILNEPVVKRVIAVGGETVDIDFDTWTVTVTDKNGEKKVLDESYIKLDPSRHAPISTQSYPLEIPEGMLFVMGDNRNASSDSRYSEIGLVDERRVLGRVILRITPFDKFGSVN